MENTIIKFLIKTLALTKRNHTDLSHPRSFLLLHWLSHSWYSITSEARFLRRQKYTQVTDNVLFEAVLRHQTESSFWLRQGQGTLEKPWHIAFLRNPILAIGSFHHFWRILMFIKQNYSWTFWKKNDLRSYCPSRTPPAVSQICTLLWATALKQWSTPVSCIIVQTFIQIALYFPDVELLHSNDFRMHLPSSNVLKKTTFFNYKKKKWVYFLNNGLSVPAS